MTLHYARSLMARTTTPTRGATPRPIESATSCDRSALVLAWTLAVLAALRLTLPFVPGMQFWGLNLGRFLPSPVGWALGSVTILGLIPRVARRLVPLADAISARTAAVSLAWALGAAMLVWWLPDRAHFVGDFILRSGAVAEGGAAATLYPQALPFDVLLHDTLTRAIAETGLCDAATAARLLGAFEAMLLARLALELARVLELRGNAALACSSTLFFGGSLGLFTGYGKAFGELSLIVAASGVLALGAVRRGRGLAALGLVIAAGLLLHRVALGLLPVLAVASWLVLRSSAPDPARRRSPTIAALAVPIATIAVMLPRLISIIRRWDVAHFAPANGGGVLASALAGTRMLDLSNLVLMLSPLALAIPLLALRLVRGRGREACVLASLALPFAIVMLFIHPAQGIARDWDDFAAGGVALSLVAAWCVGESLRASPRRAWVGVAVVLGVASAAIAWLVHASDAELALRRARALVAGPPLREATERGETLAYIATREFQLRRFDAAADDIALAARLLPTPRILREWAKAEAECGRLRDAQAIYRRLLAVKPDDAMSWLGLSAVNAALGDLDGARHAAARALALRPGDPDVMATLRYLAHRYPALLDSSAHSGLSVHAVPAAPSR